MRTFLFTLAFFAVQLAPVMAGACQVRTYVINGKVVTCHVCATHTYCN